MGKLPEGCRVAILDYLKQADLVSASIVSKQFRKDCLHNGITNPIIPVYKITLRTRILGEDIMRGQWFSFPALYEKLRRNQVEKNEKFSRYRHLKVNRVDLLVYDGRSRTVTDNEIRLDGITSVDISLPRVATTSNAWPLLRMLPNVREINMSNSYSVPAQIENCPLLEKFTGNGVRYLEPLGHKFVNLGYLKDVFLDGVTFHPGSSDELDRLLSDLADHNDTFLLCHCKSLERVSIRNAKISMRNASRVAIPQNILIKFVQNAPPSLRWFRSDLTQENINLLRKEHPG